MSIGGQRESKGPGVSSLDNIEGQQCRLRIRLLEPLNDGKGLRQHNAVIQLKRRHETLRIQSQIFRRPLRATAQMVGHMNSLYSLQIESYPHTPRRRAAKISMQSHCWPPSRGAVN